jgi:hypothetical protein
MWAFAQVGQIPSSRSCCALSLGEGDLAAVKRRVGQAAAVLRVHHRQRQAAVAQRPGQAQARRAGPDHKEVDIHGVPA